MKEKKGIPWSMNTLVICFLLLAASIFLLSLQETVHVNQRIREQREIEVQRQNSQRESKALQDAGDYLTSQVWHYLATGKRKYMDAYWKEIQVDRNRDKAMTQLEKLDLHEEEIQ